jgi:hypothetical protein
VDLESHIAQLKSLLADRNEALFLSKQDMERMRIENIALKNFIQNLYESCEVIEESELELIQVIQNLKRNIQIFAKDNNINL